jgi:flagellar hook-associated protein 2
VARDASNAHFTVNGMEASASSNTFILQNDYEITLNSVSENEGQTVTIGVKPDTIALQENISNLIGGYNDFIRSVNEYRESQERSQYLTKEMGKLAGFYQEGMSKLGIVPNEDGTLSLDGDKLNEAVALEESPDAISSLKLFSQSVLRKSDQVALNPISYVNKVVVAYKNPSHTLYSPYVTSAYAGMMFNNYC